MDDINYYNRKSELINECRHNIKALLKSANKSCLGNNLCPMKY